jgi:hypothetical protein
VAGRRFAGDPRGPGRQLEREDRFMLLLGQTDLELAGTLGSWSCRFDARLGKLAIRSDPMPRRLATRTASTGPSPASPPAISTTSPLKEAEAFPAQGEGSTDEQLTNSLVSSGFPLRHGEPDVTPGQLARLNPTEITSTVAAGLGPVPSPTWPRSSPASSIPSDSATWASRHPPFLGLDYHPAATSKLDG